MADMGIQVNTNNINVNPGIRPVQGGNAGGVSKVSKPDAEQEKKRVDLALENVVSVSEDGDTVQATDESMERLEEDAFGKVVAQGNDENRNTVTGQDIDTREDEIPEDDRLKTQASAENQTKNTQSENVQKDTQTVQEQTDNPTKQRLEEANDPDRIDPTKERLKEANDPNKPDPVKERIEAQKKRQERAEARAEIRENIDTTKDAAAKTGKATFNGYTDAQLEQMYIKGEISRNDYDREMDARKERAEEIQSGNREFNKEMAAEIAAEELTTRQGEEVKTVYSPDSSDTLTAKTRDEILTGLQDFSLNN